jgi:hypothetical protein
VDSPLKSCVILISNLGSPLRNRSLEAGLTRGRMNKACGLLPNQRQADAIADITVPRNLQTLLSLPEARLGIIPSECPSI